MYDNQCQLKRNTDLAHVSCILDACIVYSQSDIIYAGPQEGWDNWDSADIHDAQNQVVTPGFIDSHTHLVFAHTREHEYVAKIQGKSYAEIAAMGGGILNSARNLHALSHDTLLTHALYRLQRAIQYGTTAIEIKSGYGLLPEQELKMLEVIQQLSEVAPIPISPTFLAGHAIPPELGLNSQEYIRYMIEKCLPQILHKKLCTNLDIFCENHYFSLQDTEFLLQTAQSTGLNAKIHANQFSSLGAIPLAVQYGAKSVDHLEVMLQEDYDALSGASTIATLLPMCSFHIHIPYAPARKLIEQNAAIALASDYNPGSSPASRMQFAMYLGCNYMKLLPEEALNATTLNAAYALGLEHTHGAFFPGSQSPAIIWNSEVKDLSSICYNFGDSLIDRIIAPNYQFHSPNFSIVNT